MSLLQALTLGIVQGLTEFLPISSSGHLIVLPSLFGWGIQPLVFDTVLHMGTALAIIVYFWKDLWKIAHDFVKRVDSKEASLGKYILIGSIPAGVFGFFLENVIETTFRGINWVLGFLLFGSILMWIAEKWFNSEKYKITAKKSLVIGLFQSLALFPGVSRSGSTISAGMYLGLGREQATRFSFLLAIPTVLGAGLYKLLSSYAQLSSLPQLVLIAGFVSSFVVGLFAIKFLINFVKSHSLYMFIYYRVWLALLLIIYVNFFN